MLLHTKALLIPFILVSNFILIMGKTNLLFFKPIWILIITIDGLPEKTHIQEIGRSPPAFDGATHGIASGSPAARG